MNTAASQQARSIAVIVSLLLVAGACSSSAEQAAPTDPTPPTPTEAATPLPIPAPTEASVPTEPPIAPPEAPAPGVPSQSNADAERDGILPVLAELSFAERVDIKGEVTVAKQRWVISRLPTATTDQLGYTYFVDRGLDPHSAELLHLDGDQIVRAVSMPSSPATWIIGSDDLVFAGRQGDGGYPDSSVVRVNVATGETLKLYLPRSYANRGWIPDSEWQFVSPEALPGLLPVLKRAMVAHRHAAEEDFEAAARDLDQQMNVVETYDPTQIPKLAFGMTCPIVDWAGGLLFDFGDACVFQQDDPSRVNPTVMVGSETVAGTLVGAGHMDGGTAYAAIVSAGVATRVEDPLLFVEVYDPANQVDTGIAGRDEGTQILQVSFFDGGYVATQASDLSTNVLGFDSNGQPLSSFVSPTDRDLGYPPDPAIEFASVSPDGESLAYIERDWPRDGSGEPGRGVALVVADMATGEETSRAETEIDTDEFVTWMEYDGRWVAVSGMNVADFDYQPPNPILIDTDTGTFYPLGIDDLGLATFQRATD